jgi:serine protease AprX
MAGMTWNSWAGVKFPPGAVGNGPISGNPEAMAAFSSRGPCRDRRVKPDVVAPGTDILSTRSSKAPSTAFWGEYGTDRSYAYMGGTSMAAPIATGLALLVRQWYVEQGHQPSAALLKATLINGCRWLGGSDSVSSNAAPPNYDQGFGELHLPSTLPNDASDPPLVLHFVDTLRTSALQFTKQTDRPIQAKVQVGDRLPLRVCLCFTDAPGRAIQNDLTLIVEKPDRSKTFGNADRPKQFAGSDVDNTVEIVRIARPIPGDYLIHIVAGNIIHPPQGFALVVSGDLGPDIEPRGHSMSSSGTLRLRQGSHSRDRHPGPKDPDTS